MVDQTGNTKPCPDCGKELEEKAKFCTDCGYKFAVVTPAAVSQDDTVRVANTKPCPDCGKELEDKAKFCTDCGYKFNQPSPPVTEPAAPVSSTPVSTEIIKPQPVPKAHIGDVKLELKLVTKVYKGGVRAVSGVSFNVRDKELVLLIGPSGSGKSTILNMIAGFEDLTGGQILIDGYEISNVPAGNRTVAAISQDYNSSPDGKSTLNDMMQSKSRLNQGKLSFHLTSYDNMAYDLQQKKVPKAEIDMRIKQAAKILNIDALLSHKPRALSPSQQFLVALGRSIVFNPKVFLFDDPLAGIDGDNTRTLMRDELSGILNRINATVIYAASDHDESILAIADRVIVIKDGEIEVEQ